MNARGTVVVTGTSSGIGAATANLLSEQGWRVIGLDRRAGDTPLDTFLACDLTEPDAIDRAVAAIDGPIHGLVNVAGVPGSLDGETVMRVNLLGLRHLTETLMPAMAPGGAVIHIASGAGSGWRDNLPQVRSLLAERSFADGLVWVRSQAMSGPQAYNFSKEAVIVYALLGSMLWRAHGVRSLSLSPGVVETPILKDFEDTMGKAVLERLRDQSGGRNGTPGDIAPVIAFLLSPEAAWINGTDLGVDGGSEVAIALGLLDCRADEAADLFLSTL